MTHEELAQLSEQEILDLAASNPRVYKALVDTDPRVRLHDLLYGSDKKLDGKRVDGKLFREVIEEMGVEIAPDSHLARARRHARAEVEPVMQEVTRLRNELLQEREQEAERAFRDEVRGYLDDAGALATEEHVDRVLTFMTENQYGPKAAKNAIGAYLDSAAPATPNYESEQGFTLGDEADEHIKQLAKLGPGDDLGPSTPRGLAHAERVWREMFGTEKRPSPAFTNTR